MNHVNVQYKAPGTGTGNNLFLSFFHQCLLFSYARIFCFILSWCWDLCKLAMQESKELFFSWISYFSRANIQTCPSSTYFLPNVSQPSVIHSLTFSFLASFILKHQSTQELLFLVWTSPLTCFFPFFIPKGCCEKNFSVLNGIRSIIYTYVL